MILAVVITQMLAKQEKTDVLGRTQLILQTNAVRLFIGEMSTNVFG
jgi:hypothetical protein